MPCPQIPCRQRGWALSADTCLTRPLTTHTVLSAVATRRSGSRTSRGYPSTQSPSQLRRKPRALFVRCCAVMSPGVLASVLSLSSLGRVVLSLVQSAHSPACLLPTPPVGRPAVPRAREAMTVGLRKQGALRIALLAHRQQPTMSRSCGRPHGPDLSAPPPFVPRRHAHAIEEASGQTALLLAIARRASAPLPWKPLLLLRTHARGSQSLCRPGRDADRWARQNAGGRDDGPLEDASRPRSRMPYLAVLDIVLVHNYRFAFQ